MGRRPSGAARPIPLILNWLQDGPPFSLILNWLKDDYPATERNRPADQGAALNSASHSSPWPGTYCPVRTFLMG